MLFLNLGIKASYSVRNCSRYCRRTKKKASHWRDVPKIILWPLYVPADTAESVDLCWGWECAQKLVSFIFLYMTLKKCVYTSQPPLKM